MLVVLDLIFNPFDIHINDDVIGAYLLLLLISWGLRILILYKAGLMNLELKGMKKKAVTSQKTALKDMKKLARRTNKHTELHQGKLSASELEVKLSQVWGAEIWEKAESIEKPENQATTVTRKTKEYRKWPTYALVVVFVIAMIFRLIEVIS
ncbi:hypothetical protein KO561_19700 [Radiobacillus kanasensis]|uniref:hypothetical protein n=1 Tax=Radiobacillus kanasensis TaxID=2844358 RepID=UPI001E42FE17|nr:hypothetical protein [Radiobacillus kanasensis]UFT99364.1 hypothetical protein KO561_19700 [Radiobacillus kanasensis]